MSAIADGVDTTIGPAQEASAAGVGVDAIVIDPLEVAGSDEVPGLNEAGRPKALRAYVVHQDPKITIIPNFVSDSEIEHLLEISKGFWFPSVVGRGVYKTNDENKDMQNEPSKNRTSYSCMLRSAQTDTVQSIEHRLAHVAGIDVDYLERLNMVRYMPGQFFNVHHDGRFRPKTVFLYLNDLPDDDAGETLFPELGLKIRPRRGCAVMWANTLSPGIDDIRTFHQGLAPRTGVKFGVNCFFNDKPLRHWEDVDSDLGDQEDIPANAKGQSRWRVVDPGDFKVSDAMAKEHEPMQVKAFVVNQEPKVMVIPSFLQPGEAALIRSCIGGEVKENDELCLARIEQRMAAAAQVSLLHMDPLRIAKCTPSMTPDGQVLAGNNYKQRFGKKVVQIFLNDVDDGGELRFPKLRMQIRPMEGCAVVWSTDTVHQGRPPKVGERFVASGIFRENPVRSPNAAP